jgi:PAS domain S-box-containing protein
MQAGDEHTRTAREHRPRTAPSLRARSASWRIPVLYLAFGGLWIVASDRVLEVLAGDNLALLARMQAWKGVSFLAVTALLLYLLLRPLINRLLRARQRAVDSEARWRELFEANPGPMWIYDLDSLRLLDINPAAEAFLGWRREELRGQALSTLWPDEDRGYFEQALARIRSQPQVPYSGTERIRVRDGSLRVVDLRSSPLSRAEGSRGRLVVLADRTAEQAERRLREQALVRLREAQRLARLGSWELDPATGRASFCPVLLQLLGLEGVSAVPTRLREVLVAADAASQARLDPLLDDLQQRRVERIDILLPFLGPAGSERLLRLRGEHTEEDGRPLLRGTVQDLTEEQQTRRLLDEREQQFRELVRLLPDGVLILAGEIVIYANPACGGLFGIQPEALLGEPLAALVHPDDLGRLRAWLENGAGQEASPQLLRSDGSRFRASLGAAHARYGGRDCRLLLVRDLSEPERMRDALARGNRELQAMAARLFSAQEDERRAISRELHDDIGQAITAIKLSVHAAAAEADPERRQLDLDGIGQVADATLEKLRNLSMLLRPPQLDALGLESALRWHAGTLLRNASLALELDIGNLPRRPEREVEQACFRIAQEALTNALRHAGASRVRLALEDAGGHGLRLCIEDDGVGFDPARARGLGLVIMRERAQSAGGQLQIDTRPQGGTRIQLNLPYARQPLL